MPAKRQLPLLLKTTAETFAVATAPQPPGHPLSDNVITLTTSNGELANADFEQPRTVEPSPKPGVALVRSLAGILALLDVASGEIIPLQIPEDEQAQLTATYSHDSQRTRVRFHAPLVGTDRRLVGRSDQRRCAESDHVAGRRLRLSSNPPQISPDGTWVLYSTGTAGFLISLETPGEPQPIDTEPLLPYPSFDVDGDVLYAVGDDGVTTIRSLDPDTGLRTDVAVAPGVRMLPLQQGDPLLMFDAQHLLTLAPGASAPSMLFEWSGGPLNGPLEPCWHASTGSRSRR